MISARKIRKLTEDVINEQMKELRRLETNEIDEAESYVQTYVQPMILQAAIARRSGIDYSFESPFKLYTDEFFMQVVEVIGAQGYYVDYSRNKQEIRISWPEEVGISNV